jgi:hypothetical protein
MISRAPLAQLVMSKNINILRHHSGFHIVKPRAYRLTFINATSNHIKFRKNADCSQHPATALICMVERLNYSLVLLLVRGE